MLNWACDRSGQWICSQLVAYALAQQPELNGRGVLRLPFDDLLGVASGATGNPAIVVYAARMAPTDRPDIAYAMIFPSATIVKVIAVQIVGLAMMGT